MSAYMGKERKQEARKQKKEGLGTEEKHDVCQYIVPADALPQSFIRSLRIRNIHWRPCWFMVLVHIWYLWYRGNLSWMCEYRGQ